MVEASLELVDTNTDNNAKKGKVDTRPASQGPHLAVYVVTAVGPLIWTSIPTILTLRAEHGETL